MNYCINVYHGSIYNSFFFGLYITVDRMQKVFKSIYGVFGTVKNWTVLYDSPRVVHVYKNLINNYSNNNKNNLLVTTVNPCVIIKTGYSVMVVKYKTYPVI
jgi:hypothetical protein